MHQNRCNANTHAIPLIPYKNNIIGYGLMAKRSEVELYIEARRAKEKCISLNSSFLTVYMYTPLYVWKCLEFCAKMIAECEHKLSYSDLVMSAIENNTFYSYPGSDGIFDVHID